MVFRNECYRLIIARSQNQIEYQMFVSLTLDTPPYRVPPPPIQEKLQFVRCKYYIVNYIICMLYSMYL